MTELPLRAGTSGIPPRPASIRRPPGPRKPNRPPGRGLFVDIIREVDGFRSVEQRQHDVMLTAGITFRTGG